MTGIGNRMGSGIERVAERYVIVETGKWICREIGRAGKGTSRGRNKQGQQNEVVTERDRGYKQGGDNQMKGNTWKGIGKGRERDRRHRGKDRLGE